MKQGISYRDFLNQVEARFLEHMPEAYSQHHVRIEQIHVFDGTLEILGVFHEDIEAAPGINIRDYFKKFLGCWNMDKVLEEMAADYLKLDKMLHHELREGIVAGPTEAMPKRRYPAHREYER